jgi:hypothetical protein
MTGMAALTHGLQLWQQVCLIALLGILFCWALAATILPQVYKPYSNPGVIDPARQLALRERIFTICREMGEYALERGVRPDEERLWEQFRNDSKEFHAHYQAEIQSWDDKIGAGYWLQFKDRACNLRHELVLNGVPDGILDKALSDLDREPKKGYAESLRTLIERLRYAASRLP